MLELYYAPRTRAERVRWALEELELTYRLVPVNHRQPDGDFLRLNPLGQVPVLVCDGEVWTESGAICLALADRFPRTSDGVSLAPANAERAAYYRWSFFVFANLEGPLMKAFTHSLLLPEHRRSDKALQEAVEQLQPRLAMLKEALCPYVCGPQFTMADILVGSCLVWADELGLLAPFPELQAYLLLLRQRPAFAKLRH